MDQFLIFLSGVVVAVLGYFLKRWWEGQSLKDGIQRITDLLRLHNELSETNISERVLSDLRKSILSQRRWRRQDEEDVLGKIADALRAEVKAENSENPELRTQSEMNQYVFHLANLADAEVDYQVKALKQYLDSHEVEGFDTAQSAWESFAKLQSEFASLQVEGGTMQPLLRASEHRDLAIARAAYLKDEVRRRAAVNPIELPSA